MSAPGAFPSGPSAPESLPTITPPSTPTAPLPTDGSQTAAQDGAAINAVQARLDALEAAFAIVQARYNAPLQQPPLPVFADLLAALSWQFKSTCAFIQHFGYNPPPVPAWPSDTPPPPNGRSLT
jgi:hypothetical protein